MTLTTHAVTGALIGAVASQNLAFAAAAAFMTHLLLDAIPHRDYQIHSTKRDALNPLNNDMVVRGRQFYIDLLKIGFDFWLGMIIVIVIFWTMPSSIFVGALVGAVFGVLPDPLQFVYWKFRPRFLKPIQQFHLYIHAKNRLKDQLLLGIVSQLLIIILTLTLIKVIY
jgi:hypothetical protein